MGSIKPPFYKAVYSFFFFLLFIYFILIFGLGNIEYPFEIHRLDFNNPSSNHFVTFKDNTKRKIIVKSNIGNDVYS